MRIVAKISTFTKTSSEVFEKVASVVIHPAVQREDDREEPYMMLRFRSGETKQVDLDGKTIEISEE